MLKKTLLLITVSFLLLSCKRQGELPENIITERIQYDVFIKSPDPDLDWWVQNIEGSRREQFVQLMIDFALQGKVKTYDYANTPLSPVELKNLLYRTDSLQIQSPRPPYDYIDTVIIQNLDIKDIVKVRFLEEWYQDRSTLLISKKVLGIAPVAAVYHDDGELKGYKPLFWIYFDHRYPLKSTIN